MNHPNGKTVYELVTGKKTDSRLTETEPAGYAFRFGESRHYVVKPKSASGKKSYYVLKLPYSKFEYVVFSKLSRRKNGPRFRDEIGRARLSPVLKSHLEIHTNGEASPLFMNLYPLDV